MEFKKNFRDMEVYLTENLSRKKLNHVSTLLPYSKAK